MAIKWTIQGLLIYTALAMYVLAFVARLFRVRRAGQALYFLGFAVAGVAVVYRWWHVWHVPMQNLFEVFLCLGVLIWPISLLCRRRLGVGGVAGDMVIAAIVLFPAGLIFSAEPQQLPPALQSGLFGPHVFVYMLAYIFMAKASVQAAAQLAGKEFGEGFAETEEGTYRMVCAGFPLLTLGLVLGSVWGQQAWGDWWGWDPKELWSLASWLVYVGYLHWRYMQGRRYPRVNSVWVVVGMAVILVTLLWVNLSRLFEGLHSYAR